MAPVARCEICSGGTYREIDGLWRRARVCVISQLGVGVALSTSTLYDGYVLHAFLLAAQLSYLAWLRIWWMCFQGLRCGLFHTLER